MAYQWFIMGDRQACLPVHRSTIPGESDFVLLEDVQDEFETTSKRFTTGGLTLAFMRDANLQRYIPERLPCKPDSWIHIVETNQAGPGSIRHSHSTPSSMHSAQPSHSTTVTTISPISPSSPSSLVSVSTLSSAISDISISSFAPHPYAVPAVVPHYPQPQPMYPPREVYPPVGYLQHQQQQQLQHPHYHQMQQPSPLSPQPLFTHHQHQQQQLLEHLPPSTLVVQQRPQEQKQQLLGQLPPSQQLLPLPKQSLGRHSSIQIQGQMHTVNRKVEEAVQAGRPLDGPGMEKLISTTIVPTAQDGNINFQQYMIQNMNQLNESVGGLTQQGDLLEQLARKTLRMQQEALDRLALIQSKAEAILTQNFELQEYTIPRLFIILPEDTSAWDPKNIFRNKFRLHFICECGEHTKKPNSKIPHHLHLAKHEGYVIRQPSTFLKKYGPFVRVLLETIKIGAHVAGTTLPGLANLKLIEMAGQALDTCDSVTSKLILGVDQSIAYLDKFKDQQFEGQQTNLGTRELSSYLAGVEALEGSELRQLAQFLKAGDNGNLLGNMYRMANKEGRVFWVCGDHFREGYQGSAAGKLADLVTASGGAFDTQLGTLEMVITSPIAASQLYEAIEKARGIFQLKVDLNWSQSYNDLVAFKTMLTKTNITTLSIGLHRESAPRFDFVPIGKQRFDPIFEIMRHRSIQTISLKTLPELFFKKSSQYSTMTNLQCLEIDWLDIPFDGDGRIKFRSLMTNVPNLQKLQLWLEDQDILRAYNAMLDFQPPFAVHYSNWMIVPGTDKEDTNLPIRRPAPDLWHLIRMYADGKDLLEKESKDELGTLSDIFPIAIDFATEQNPKELKYLKILYNQYSELGYNCFSKILSRSTELVRLDYLFRQREFLPILENIPWSSNQLTTLKLTTGFRRDPFLELEMIRDCLSNHGSPKNLKSFEFNHSEMMSVESFELIREMVSNMEFESLGLMFPLYGTEWMDLVQIMNYKRLKYLRLGCHQGFIDQVEGQFEQIMDLVLRGGMKLRAFQMFELLWTEPEWQRLSIMGINLMTVEEVYCR